MNDKKNQHVWFQDLDSNAVWTRYYNSIFMWMAASSDLLDVFKTCFNGFYDEKKLQVSIGRPNLIKSFLYSLNEEQKNNELTELKCVGTLISLISHSIRYIQDSVRSMSLTDPCKLVLKLLIGIWNSLSLLCLIFSTRVPHEEPKLSGELGCCCEWML